MKHIKHLFILLLCVALAFSSLGVTAFAAETEPLITSFSLLGYAGTVDNTANTLTVEIPYESRGLLTNAIPHINTLRAVSITPDSSAPQDFTRPVTYTVSNNIGETKVYSVVIIVGSADGSACSIDRFAINDHVGTIDNASNRITVKIPSREMSSITNVTPSITYTGISITPIESSPQNFANTVQYTVSSIDGTVTKTYTVVIEEDDSDKDCAIDSFAILGRSGVINESTKTITVTMPYAYKDNIKNIVPSIVWHGQSISPVETASQDFSNPVLYTLTALNPSFKKTYTVNVVIDNADTTARITSFKLFGQDGVINETARLITVTVPFSAKDRLQNAVPRINYIGSAIEPAAGTAMDFSTETSVVVYAEDPDVFADYTVKVTVDGDPSIKKINSFKILGQSGVIDENAHTINITIPYKDRDKLTAVTPVIDFTGKSIYPTADTPQNFSTGAVEYIVRAKDETTVAYSVKATVDANAYLAKINSFALLDNPGVIDETNKTIYVEIPSDMQYKIQSVVPKIDWTGVKIEPSDTAKLDFNKKVYYTVTAENGTRQTYTVMTDITEETKCQITSFNIFGYEAEIDDIKGTITATIPYKYKDDLAKVIPTIVWSGSAITPDDTKEADLSKKLSYTVTAKDKITTKRYVVEIKLETPSRDCYIESFFLFGKSAIVDNYTQTIRLSVDKQANYEKAKSAVPIIKYKGASVSPGEDQAMDFTTDQVYLVQAEDPTVSKYYTVSVEFTDFRVPKIERFKIGKYYGVINQDTGDINFTIPKDAIQQFTSATPIITWTGETISPKDNASQDFTSDIIYDVSVGEKKKQYNVHVDYELDTTCQIDSFVLLNQEGVINRKTNTITFTFDAKDRAKLQSTIPFITWSGASITPDENEPHDFTNFSRYTVKAEDPNVVQTYVVRVDFDNEVEILTDDDDTDDAIDLADDVYDDNNAAVIIDDGTTSSGGHTPTGTGTTNTGNTGADYPRPAAEDSDVLGANGYRNVETGVALVALPICSVAGLVALLTIKKRK